MAQVLSFEHVWTDKSKYDEAERKYYEVKAKEIHTPLADEVAKARKMLKNIRNGIEPQGSKVQENRASCHAKTQKSSNVQSGIFSSHVQAQNSTFLDAMQTFDEKLQSLMDRVASLETFVAKMPQPIHALDLKSCPQKQESKKDEEDDVDLFGSESEEEDDAAARAVREKRLADYEAKKSKKPVLIAKSNVILDVKPWDDETDMKELEVEVRKIATPGLLWGASKLVPLAYGIHKLQISCVIEDDQVSVDWLQEQIESIENYVQSVDIAAFNKI